MRRLLSSSFALAFILAIASASAQNPYSVLAHWKIGGTGGWDYLLADAPAQRLYVTHNSRVEVLDTNTGNLAGAIVGLKSTHGIALPNEDAFGYISDGAANAVIVFDRRTLAIVASIPAGMNPDGITYEPVTKSVWAFNGRSNNVTVIDTATRKVVATVPLPGKPEFPQADGKGNVFVNVEDKNSIAKLDARNKQVLATWRLTDCESPSGLAMDRQGDRLFAVCDGKKMAVVDANSGKQIASAAIGDSPDAAAFDSRNQLVFASTADGLVTVIDARAGYKTIQSLATMKSGRTMAYDASADRIYVSAAKLGPPPAATAANPKPRPSIVPDTFQIVVIGRR